MRLLFATILCVAYTCAVCAQNDEIDYEKQGIITTWYADHAESILTRFEGLRHDSGQLPQKCSVFCYPSGQTDDFAFAVSTWDERFVVLYLPNGRDVTAKVVRRNELPNDIYWSSISNLGTHATKSDDITLRERPLPVRNFEKARNVFNVIVEHEDGLKASAYNQMIFKPHQNAVRLASSHRDTKKDEQGNIIHDEMSMTFALKEPAIVSKMFRGYDDDEAVPWVVKSSFFNTHTLLQYSRWKEGETVRKASPDTKRIISSYYGGRAIADSRWLASVESAERSFYAVQFQPKGEEALAALVCIAEGEVASTWEFHGTYDPNCKYCSVWFVDDDGDFMEHAPQIHCVAATDKGLELYVRQFGGESVQYVILREIGSVLMEMQNDTWVYVWEH